MEHACLKGMHYGVPRRVCLVGQRLTEHACLKGMYYGMPGRVYFVVWRMMLFTVIPKGPPVLLPVPRKTRSRSVKNVADAKFAGKTTPAH